MGWAWVEEWQGSPLPPGCGDRQLESSQEFCMGEGSRSKLEGLSS